MQSRFSWFLTITSARLSLFSISEYAPRPAQCPTTVLVRAAENLSVGEAQYRFRRAEIATTNLRSWLSRLSEGLTGNATFPDTNLPVIGFASSGGGIRSVLTGAGIIQELDSRDSVAGGSLMNGLYQAITYHSGTSSGAWLLAALAGNEGVTISSLKNNVWASSFRDRVFLPDNLPRGQAYAEMTMALFSKGFAGFDPTLVDGWGRLLSYALLYGDQGGIAKTMSGVINNLDFASFNTPYPIMTALGVNPSLGRTSCILGDMNSTQYEFHPYEYGSWDIGHRAFSQTAYMGTCLDNGLPLSSRTCVNGLDNLGFLLGASSNVFNLFCTVVSSNKLSGTLGEIQNDIISMTSVMHPLSFMDEYAVIPNPFLNWQGQMSTDENIYLVDGSQGGETIPLWPLIQPERGIDVIIANDNSANTRDNYPNGTSLYNTYIRAQRLGLDTMPVIPPARVFVERGFNKRPTFFGCFDPTRSTIIYLPITNHTVQNNISTWELQYSFANVTSMIENGNQIATMGRNQTWPICLACGMLSKRSTPEAMPSECGACLEEFCWRE